MISRETLGGFNAQLVHDQTLYLVHHNIGGIARYIYITLEYISSRHQGLSRASQSTCFSVIYHRELRYDNVQGSPPTYQVG